jgi:hypothetical protein
MKHSYLDISYDALGAGSAPSKAGDIPDVVVVVVVVVQIMW